MTQEQQLDKMRLEILGNDTDTTKDDLFILRLMDAEIVALNTLYPYDLTVISLDKTNIRLANWQVRCAIELHKAYERIGVQAYSENNLSVSFLTSLLSPNLLGEFVPKAGVPK